MALMNTHCEIFAEFDMTPRQHTRYLPMMLSAVLLQAGLQRADIDFIAYASGPGAFTGVRIATATAQGLSIGLGIPMISVSTLAVLAQLACERYQVDKVQVAIDARMGEVYTALYIKNSPNTLVELSGKEQLIILENLVSPPDTLSAGSGFKARSEAGFNHLDKGAVDADLYPHASVLVKLARLSIDAGLYFSADKAEINYIRNRVAEKKRS